MPGGPNNAEKVGVGLPSTPFTLNDTIIWVEVLLTNTGTDGGIVGADGGVGFGL